METSDFNSTGEIRIEGLSVTRRNLGNIVYTDEQHYEIVGTSGAFVRCLPVDRKDEGGYHYCGPEELVNPRELTWL